MHSTLAATSNNNGYCDGDGDGDGYKKVTQEEQFFYVAGFEVLLEMSVKLAGS